MFKTINITIVVLLCNFAAANDITEIPAELKAKISANLPLKDILNFCQTSKKINAFCEIPNFWRLLLQRDYPDSYRDGIQNPKDLYKSLSIKDPYEGTILSSNDADGSGDIGQDGKPTWLIVRLTHVPARFIDDTIRVGTDIYFHPTVYVDLNPSYGQKVLFDTIRNATRAHPKNAVNRVRIGAGIKSIN